MKTVHATPTTVILVLGPRTQFSPGCVAAGSREWRHSSKSLVLAPAARWVLGTSPRMTFEQDAASPHGATP
jgi:hypothetical protein